jgi:hypothetical protein
MEWRGTIIMVTPDMRIRSDHPIVEQAGMDAFERERRLDLEDLR